MRALILLEDCGRIKNYLVLPVITNVALVSTKTLVEGNCFKVIGTGVIKVLV